MRAKPTLAAVFLGLLLAAPAAAQSWQVFSFPEAGFAVQLPEAPRAQKTTYIADGAAVAATVWTYRRPGAVFSVTVTDLSGKNLKREAAIEAAVKAWSQGGEVKLDVVARIDREFGRQLSLMRPDGARSTASVFFVNDRLYLLEGRLAAGEGASADGARFQQSLEFIGLGAEIFRPENRPDAGRGGPPRPPPEAFAACKSKVEGERVSFTGPLGRGVDASCAASPGGLVAPARPAAAGIRPASEVTARRESPDL